MRNAGLACGELSQVSKIEAADAKITYGMLVWTSNRIGSGSFADEQGSVQKERPDQKPSPVEATRPSG